jgi:hypothetical protein
VCIASANSLGCPADKSFCSFAGFMLGHGSSTLVLYKRKALAKDAASVRTTPASADSRFLTSSPPANSSTRRWRTPDFQKQRDRE